MTNTSLFLALKRKLQATTAAFLVLGLFTMFSSGITAQTQTFTSSGAYTVPAGATHVIVECIGGGGGGGRIKGGASGGGGGGAYAKSILPVTPGSTHTVTVGVGGAGATGTNPGGDSWFSSTATIMAKGGAGTSDNEQNGSLGGSAAASVGDITFSGGNGGNGGNTSANGGGGGGAAGETGNGGNGSNFNGGIGDTPGGNGGNGRLKSLDYGVGLNGLAYGGGGGGAVAGSALLNLTYNGGNGAPGMVRVTVVTTPVTFSNYSSDPTLTTSYAHRKGASVTPKFTITSLISFNSVQFELNTQSDFSGTATVSTINPGSTYAANTLHDIWTTTPLPTDNRTYFVRCRVSADGGSTWSEWTTELWPYSYFSGTLYEEEGWYYTTGEQFNTGVVQETLYDHTLVTTTPFPDDGNITLSQGAFNLAVSNNEDQYLTEGTDNFSGSTSNYLTVGSYYSGSRRQDYNGFRFTGFPVPNGASILSSNLKVYSHHTGGEPISNNTNPLYLELVGVNQTNVNSWANSTNTATGGPRWRVRKSITTPWDITDPWADLTLMTSPDISAIIEDIVSTTGYDAGNAIGVIIDYTGNANTSANRHRYFSTGRRNVAYRPRVEGTFTNFKNTVFFPSVKRDIYGLTDVNWDELRITDNTNCNSCEVEYRIHNASNGAVVAGPFVRVAGLSGSQSFDISTVADQEIFVSSTIYRTNTTPQIDDLWLTVTTCETFGTDTQVACDTYTWIDGNTYTASNNTATHTLTNAAGCDSIVTLDLTINYTTTGTDTQTACESYTWIDGNTYTASNNTATHTLTNAAGCDSIVTLDLTINYTTTGTDTQTACESYTWIDGNTYTASNNTATHTLTNAAGCDSIVTLDLTINYTTTGTDTQTACESYTWIDGNTYTASNNTATHTLTNAAGCDSIVTLDLTINYTTTGTDTQTACESYTWIDGNTYTASNNTATHTLTNAAGCDSIVTLDLTINYTTTGTDTQTACESYTWIDGNTYTASNNTATHTLTNAAGCDSIVTLDLTINYTTTGTDTQTACESYTWIDGNTYTASNNTATHTLTNAAGCDSIVTLNLTINYTTTGTDTQTACESYTWIDGNTYTASNNTATHTLTNAAGCDSIVTLDLTINNTTTGTDTQTACESYTWIDGNTYTASNNTATHTLTNAAGCDSIVTLNLTINYTTTGTDTQTACESYTWIDGNTYTASNNTATHTLTNAAGCDSIVTLDLTINNTTTGTDTQTACESYTWIDGNTYTASNNTATHTLTNAAGCDSIVTLNLTINYSPVITIPSGGIVCEGSTLNLSPATGGTWTSSDPTVATIDNNGLLTGVSEGVTFVVFTDNTTGCSSSITSGEIIVNGLPTISFGDFICDNTTQTYSVEYYTNPNATVTASIGEVTSTLITGIPYNNEVIITSSIEGCPTVQEKVSTDECYKPVVHVFNGVSPNGDGVNDFLEITDLEYYPENELLIYNRWGNKVYQSAPYANDWNGQNNVGGSEKELPAGTYFYILNLGEGEDAMKGYIELKR